MVISTPRPVTHASEISRRMSSAVTETRVRCNAAQEFKIVGETCFGFCTADHSYTNVLDAI